MNVSSPVLTLSNTSGPSVPTALPIWNAQAPAMMYSAASRHVEIPPTPIRGMSRTLLRS